MQIFVGYLSAFNNYERFVEILIDDVKKYFQKGFVS